jgi:hypothetical protein
MTGRNATVRGLGYIARRARGEFVIGSVMDVPGWITERMAAVFGNEGTRFHWVILVFEHVVNHSTPLRSNGIHVSVLK